MLLSNGILSNLILYIFLNLYYFYVGLLTGAFTTNVVAAAPVLYCKTVLNTSKTVRRKSFFYLLDSDVVLIVNVVLYMFVLGFILLFMF